MDMAKAARPNTFLKRHPKLVGNLVRDAFSGGELGVHGKIMYFSYSDEDCSDFSKIGLPVKGQKYGAGYQLIVQYGKRSHCLFYAERECKSLKAFLDILNTDAGMAQLMYGEATRFLNINYYDFNNDLIQFSLNNEISVRKSALSACWNVKTSTFNVKKYMQLRHEAEREAGLPESDRHLKVDHLQLHHVSAEKYQATADPMTLTQPNPATDTIATSERPRRLKR